MKVLPLAEAKAKLSEIVSEVTSRDEGITITRNGRAVAVLVSAEEFERWRETVEILADPDLLSEIRKGMADLRAGRAKSFRGKDLDRLFDNDRSNA
jgi:prevent-host-death family protein